VTGDEFRAKVYGIILQHWPIHDGCQKKLIEAGYDDEALWMLVCAMRSLRFGSDGLKPVQGLEKGVVSQQPDAPGIVEALLTEPQDSNAPGAE